LHCAKYMLGNDAKPTSLVELSGGGLSGAVEGSKNAGGSYEDGMNQSKSGGAKAAASGGAVAAAGGAAAAPAASGITLEEVAKHNTKTDCWVVLNGEVLNVTDFLKDHPGGELAIMTFAGKDASEEFNMIHPPDVVGKYLDPKMNLGPLGSGAADAGGAAPGAAPAAGGAAAPKAGAAKAKPYWWKTKDKKSKGVFLFGTAGLFTTACAIIHYPFGVAVMLGGMWIMGQE